MKNEDWEIRNEEIKDWKMRFSEWGTFGLRIVNQRNEDWKMRNEK